jgi:hypothetical protein
MEFGLAAERIVDERGELGSAGFGMGRHQRADAMENFHGAEHLISH